METLTIAAVLAAIVAIGGAASVIAKATKPWRDMSAQVAEHERKLDADFKAQTETREMVNALCVAQVQVMNHMIDGNHVEQLKAARDELERKAIER